MSASGPVPRLLDTAYDDIRSDDEYVVIDGVELEALIAELQATGRDGALTMDDDDALARLVEEHVDGKKVTSVESTPFMEYFTSENTVHMPKWAREAFEAGEHEHLEKGAPELGVNRRRLHALAEAKRGVDGDGGIVECRVADVSQDYSVPVELVVDVMLELGVKRPVNADDCLTHRLSAEEIDSLLHLITSFDAHDLADRYSDRSLAELADDYDLDVDELVHVCEEEGIFLTLSSATRLQLTREDRVLDIMINDAPRKQPYPSVLEGLYTLK